MVSRDSKARDSASFLFFVGYYKVWSSGGDLVIRLYLKISEEFMRPILQERFWVVHIPFVHMVKPQFLTQFPVDHLPTQSYPSYTLFMVIFCIHLYDWSFRL